MKAKHLLFGLGILAASFGAGVRAMAQTVKGVNVERQRQTLEEQGFRVTGVHVTDNRDSSKTVYLDGFSTHRLKRIDIREIFHVGAAASGGVYALRDENLVDAAISISKRGLPPTHLLLSVASAQNNRPGFSVLAVTGRKLSAKRTFADRVTLALEIKRAMKRPAKYARQMRREARK